MPQIAVKTVALYQDFNVSAFLYAKAVRPHTSCVESVPFLGKSFLFRVLYNS